ncbi:hypothetical protein ACWKSP_26195 [Micromonosporaceae bacterium Da 78-11]
MSDHSVDIDAAAVELAMAEFVNHRARVRDMVHLYSGDANEPVRAVLMAEVFALDLLEQRMQEHLRRRVEETASTGLPPRPVGEHTQAWRIGQAPYMRRNRGHL